jgi:hypothetical protein
VTPIETAPSTSFSPHYSLRRSFASRVWEPEFCVPGRAVEFLEGKWQKDSISEVFDFWALVSISGFQFEKFSRET